MDDNAPRITSFDQVAQASDDSLRQTILTCDGAGMAIKTAVLDELVARRRKEIMAACSPRYN